MARQWGATDEAIARLIPAAIRNDRWCESLFGARVARPRCERAKFSFLPETSPLPPVPPILPRGCARIRPAPQDGIVRRFHAPGNPCCPGGGSAAAQGWPAFLQWTC